MSIRGVRELGAVDEVTHRGTTSAAASCHPPTRGVPMREVKVPLAVVTVACQDESTNIWFRQKASLQFDESLI